MLIFASRTRACTNALGVAYRATRLDSHVILVRNAHVGELRRCREITSPNRRHSNARWTATGPSLRGHSRRSFWGLALRLSSCEAEHKNRIVQSRDGM